MEIPYKNSYSKVSSSMPKATGLEKRIASLRLTVTRFEELCQNKSLAQLGKTKNKS